MRILYIITRSDAVGGAHIHVRDHCINLSKLGIDTLVLVGGNGIYTNDLSHNEVDFVSLKHLVREISVWKDVLAYREVCRVLKQFKPDLVSTHSAKAGVVGRLAAKSIGVPVIYTAHGWPFANGVPKGRAYLYKIIERLMAKLTDKIISVSEQDMQLALRHNVGGRSQHVVVHNGMPDLPSDKRSLSRSDNAVVLLTVARVDEQKDFKTLLDAFSISLKRVKARLVVVGDGSKFAFYKLYAQRLGIGENVDFVGYQRDVVPYFTQADIFILISNWEGFPRSILEAMRAHLPVIATDVGGVKESVLDGITGYLVRSRSVEEVANRIVSLCSDPMVRKKLGEAGRNLFESSFTFERMFSRNLEIYSKVIGSRSEFAD